MKKNLLFLLSFYAFLSASAQSLTPEAKIYMLTCQPGTEVYATFGHTAIYVEDNAKGINYVFNYGIFSFDEENFLYNFIKGNTYYILGVDTYDHFLMSYEYREMGIVSQELNLDDEEKDILFKALMLNALPENREYLYNFFYDNCSTRARDVIEKSVKGKLIIPPSNEVQSYRDLVAIFTGKNTWLKFGIDILIGAPADKPINDYQKMFLPYFLKDDYEKAYIENDEGEQKPLVINETVLVPEFSHKKPIWLFSPLVIMCLFFILAVCISVWDIKRRKQSVWFDFTLFLILGLIGIVVFFVSFISIHPTVFPNYNAFWLHPLHLIFAVLLLFKNVRLRLVPYHYANIGLICIAIIAGLFLQAFNAAFFPLMLAVAARSICMIKMNTPPNLPTREA